MLYSIDHAVGVARDLTDRLRMRFGNQSAPNALNNVTQTQDEWGYPIIVVSNATAGAGEGNPAVWIRITNLFEQSGSPEVSPAGAPVDIFGNATLPFTPTVCQIAYELTAGNFVVSSANATIGAVYASAAGQSFLVENTIVAGNALVTSGNMIPSAASGVLTKVSGSGDATIAYSAFAGFNLIPAASDYSVCLFEIARTGMVVQEYAQPNGAVPSEASIIPANLVSQLKDLDWGFKGNT